MHAPVLQPYPIEEPFGPNYPALPSAAKWRRKAHSGLASLSQDERREYGATVLDAINQLNRSALARATPSHNVQQCASGTNHNTGADILKAIRQHHRAALLAYPEQVRRARKPREWLDLYVKAMPPAWRKRYYAEQQRAQRIIDVRNLTRERRAEPAETARERFAEFEKLLNPTKRRKNGGRR